MPASEDDDSQASGKLELEGLDFGMVAMLSYKEANSRFSQRQQRIVCVHWRGGIFWSVHKQGSDVWLPELSEWRLNSFFFLSGADSWVWLFEHKSVIGLQFQ
jgi:hypothetical protein